MSGTTRAQAKKKRKDYWAARDRARRENFQLLKNWKPPVSGWARLKGYFS